MPIIDTNRQALSLSDVTGVEHIIIAHRIRKPESKQDAWRYTFPDHEIADYRKALQNGRIEVVQGQRGAILYAKLAGRGARISL